MGILCGGAPCGGAAGTPPGAATTACLKGPPGRSMCCVKKSGMVAPFYPFPANGPKRQAEGQALANGLYGDMGSV